MEPFKHLEAVAVPMARPNIDTDQIIPARFLQKPRKNNFGEYLFRDLKFLADGSENTGFVLNQAAYRDVRVLVAARNFGCGSSREHAVWALSDYGIRAAIAPSFGDIFFGNSLKNGFLPVVLPEAIVDGLLAALHAKPGATIAIDLPAQTVTAPDGAVHRFEIAPFPKQCLLEGLDEIGYTLTRMDEIVRFEQAYKEID